MLGRRSLVGMLAVYAGLTIAVVGASRVHACLGSRPRAEAFERAPSAELRAFLGVVAPGGVVGRWTVHEVGPLLRSGNLRVELRAGGERVALTLARRGADAPAVATTRELALYPAVHDLAEHVPTAATRAAAEALAEVLAGREAALAVPDELMVLHRSGG